MVTEGKDKVNKIRILFYSNPISSSTGYARTVREITFRLNLDTLYDIWILGQYDKNPTPRQSECGKVIGYPNWDAKNHKDALNYWIKELKPDIVWITEDMFSCHLNYGLMDVDWGDSLTVFYQPVDGGNRLTMGSEELGSKMTKIVPMSFFGEKILKESGLTNVTKPVWHGVDTSTFKPVSEEEKKKLRKHYGFNEDDFIIFNLSVNRTRKRNQRMLDIIYPFLIKNENARFIGHITNILNENNLLEYIKKTLVPRYGVDFLKNERIRFTDASFTKDHYPDSEIANLYKISDVTLSASSGEGLGYIMPESMAVGIPCLHTNFTTAEELLITPYGDIGQRGEVIPIIAEDVTGLNTSHALCDIKEGIIRLQELYDEPKLRKQLGKNGRKFAEKYLNWEYITFEFWSPLFKRLVGYHLKN